MQRKRHRAVQQTVHDAASVCMAMAFADEARRDAVARVWSAHICAALRAQRTRDAADATTTQEHSPTVATTTTTTTDSDDNNDDATRTRNVTALVDMTCTAIRLALRCPECAHAMATVTRLRQVLHELDTTHAAAVAGDDACVDKPHAELQLLVELLSLRTIVRRWSKLTPSTRSSVVQTACQLCAQHVQGEAASECACALRALDVGQAASITREQRMHLDQLLCRVADAVPAAL